MKKIDKNLLLVILGTIFGLSILMGLYNIFPFGNNIFSIIDFDSGYIPVYYKLWDVLHFQSSPLFDWNLGTGLNTLASLIGNGFISPLCWLIAIFPRDTIPYTISFVFILKLIFTSVMAYIGIGKIFPKTEGKFKILFSLMYTFSSYTFLMSSNLLYLDAFALFPILVYSLKELLDKGNWKLYVIVLTFILMSSYYMAYLNLLFIIGSSAFYLIFMDVKDKKEKASKVLICTLLSLLLSCVIFLPGFMGIRDSARMANNTSDASIFSYFMDKSIYLLPLIIPFVLTIKQLFIKKDKKVNYFILCMLVFLLLGVVFEPINALWHTGSHSGFPFRYSFEVIFFLILTSVYYINNNYKDNENKSWIRLVIPGIGMIAALVIFFLIKNDVLVRETFALSVKYVPDYIFLLVLTELLVITYIFVLRNNKKNAYYLSFALLGVITLIFGNLYFEFDKEATSVYMQDIKSKFNLINDGYNYKMEVDYNNINYPYILNIPSIENRLHFIRQEELDQAKYMGYYTHDTVIESKKSNIFFDTLLQNKYILTDKKLNKDYYTLVEEKDINKDKKVKLYSAKYNLNYLIPYNGKEYNEKNINLMENTNHTYRALFSNDDIYKSENIDYMLDNDILSIHLKENNEYYLYLEYNFIDEFGYSNDDKIELKDINIVNHEYVNIVLDVKEEGDFVFKAKNSTLENIKLYSFNKEEFIRFIDNHKLDNVEINTKGSKREYKVNIEEDTSILIPINYSDKYIIKVNGKEVEYKCNLYNMISIDLKKGSNVIEIEFSQKWLKIGFIISLVTLLVLVGLNYINKKFRFIKCKFILWPLFIISLLCFGILILKIYILSFI